jgi:hypothetical protein
MKVPGVLKTYNAFFVIIATVRKPGCWVIYLKSSFGISKEK